MAKIAMVLGATGLVGGYVTELLLNDDTWDEVRVLVRRPLDSGNPKLKQYTVDWERLDSYAAYFENVEAVFCCLGTTIKKAGSQPAFERVDLEYPLQAARLAGEAGVRQMLAVSSMGANPRSRNFYSRTKGRMEEAMAASGLPGVHLFRPSLLLGPRREFRLGERLGAVLMKTFGFLLAGRAAEYKAVHGSAVARAMVAIANTGTRGVHVYPNGVIRVIGRDGS